MAKVCPGKSPSLCGSGAGYVQTERATPNMPHGFGLGTCGNRDETETAKGGMGLRGGGHWVTKGRKSGGGC